MKKLTYRNQLSLLVFWILCVSLFFKFIPDKKVASVCAGIGFVLWPALFLLKELKSPSPSKIYSFICIEFLLISALPIFLLRILNWESEFNQLSVFGIQASELHALSNFNYCILAIAALVMNYKSGRNEKSQPEG